MVTDLRHDTRPSVPLNAPGQGPPKRLLTGRRMPSPRQLRLLYPPAAAGHDTVLRGRQRIRDLLHGRDRDRLLVIAGPCSIHDREAALEYADRLLNLQIAVGGRLMLVMRAYFEKPRTTTGWKGLIYDPRLDGSCDLVGGIAAARELLVRINEKGLPCATEFLDPCVAPYVSDLIAWGAIGARTAESQTHRQLASSLPLPVGFKNGTDGRVQTAVDAVAAAGQSHRVLGLTADGRVGVLTTRGNRDLHVVLRGGAGGTNCSPADIARAAALVGDSVGPRSVMVDCAHDNCGKDHTRQRHAFRDALAYFEAGGRALLGLALESHLHSGKQPFGPRDTLRYGVSITDACIGWEETRELILEAARVVAARAPRL